jgi:hypothetical protein
MAFSQGTTPPPIVRIVSAPGVSIGPLRNYAGPGAAVDVLGLVATTGTPQTWTVEMHPTFASIENLDQALGIPMLDGLGNDTRARVAVLQPRLSYLPEEVMRNLPKARYLRVTIYGIRPGGEADFSGLAVSRRMAGDRVNANRANLFYHVISGDDTGTYIVLSPLASLSVLDDGPADPPAYLTGDSAAKEEEIENSREHYFFRIEPRLSYVSSGFANGDPAFWRP